MVHGFAPAPESTRPAPTAIPLSAGWDGRDGGPPLIGVILSLPLTCFPALTLAPILEHLSFR